MKIFGSIFVWCLLAILVIPGCSTSRGRNFQASQPSLDSVRFVGQYVIPYNLSFNNTVVGGLSGVDYDSINDTYYFICDDRSAINPARFYTARISVSDKGIDTAYFTDVIFLQQPGGGAYPSMKTDRFKVADPEAMRLYQPKQVLAWSSEGERIVKPSDTILQAPFIHLTSFKGEHIDAFKVPEKVLPQTVTRGSRQNGVFEGLTFADNFNSLFVSMEEPLYEDGERADTIDNKAFTRILKFDVETRTQTAEYAYRLSPVARPPVPAGAFKINGISDILEVGPQQLLVVERSFSTGSTHCTIRVYKANLDKATDVQHLPSLTTSGFTEMSKTLLLNMDHLGIYIDNIEGVCYGPRLPNGNRSLVFVADNNFNPLEKSQLLLFEIIEK